MSSLPPASPPDRTRVAPRHASVPRIGDDARERHDDDEALPPLPRLAPQPYATLVAAVARIVPQANAHLIAARAWLWLAELPQHKVDDAARGLALFGSRTAALATVRRAVPFTDLAPDEQDRMLAAWGRSRVPQCRTLFQLVRRLALLAHYTTEAGQRHAGYLGALWSRDVQLAWEGPVPVHAHEPRADDAARVGHAGDAHRDDVHAGDAHQHDVRDHDARGDHEPVLRTDAPWVRTPPAAPRPAGVHDATTLSGAAHFTADAIVIGTGAGGAVAAARLAEAGKQVLVLESGEWLQGADFDEDEARGSRRLYAGSGLQGTDDLGVTMLQGRAVGGSTTVNWMIMLRTPDHVLDEWTRRFAFEGMDASSMASVFARIEREVHARRVPSDAHSRNNRLLLDGARALGWRAEEATINARGCVRSGFCGTGCRYDAKQGTLMTFVPRALAAGATLLADTEALRIEQRERGGTHPLRRVHAVVRDPRTRDPVATIIADAPIVIVAAGAVQTPVLLERSGLGGGGVGHWLRLHPTTAVAARHDDVVYGAAGIPLTAMVDEFARGDDGYGFWLECPPLHPGLAAAALPGFGAAHAARMAQFPQLATTIALTRDGAARDRSSGGVHVDRRGAVRITYRLTDADARTVRASIAAAARLQLAAGAREVITLHTDPVVVRTTRDVDAIAARSVAPNDVALFSAHVNGTCRIGPDPRTSGCTPAGERHGARGVYVMDGSLLPTGVGVNPQATIMALASVLTERLLAAWR